MALLVIGQSFVRRLEESIGDELRATISDTYRAVNMKGIPGLTVDPLARMLPYVNELSPSVIVIDIGTNDVCSRIVIPERLARHIVDVAVMFSCVSSVEIVVIMSILPLIVNRKVAAIVPDMPGVYNWKKICIRLHPEIFFLNDGIHLMWASLGTSAGWTTAVARYERNFRSHMRNPTITEKLSRQHCQRQGDSLTLFVSFVLSLLQCYITMFWVCLNK